jgi:hypothetical protein
MLKIVHGTYLYLCNAQSIIVPFDRDQIMFEDRVRAIWSSWQSNSMKMKEHELSE